MKFGTYNRDGYSGLDYADQRYYASGYGRFNTADPSRISAGPEDPSSWNRFSYVQGDPINFRYSVYLCAEDTETSVNICETNDSDVSYAQTRSPGPAYFAGFLKARGDLYKAQGQLSDRTSFTQNCEDG